MKEKRKWMILGGITIIVILIVISLRNLKPPDGNVDNVNTNVVSDTTDDMSTNTNTDNNIEATPNSEKQPEFNTEPDTGGQIAFYDFDKKVISSQDRKSGETVTPPTEVEVPYGYTFVGWDKPIESIKGSERINADFVYIQDRQNALYIDSVSGKKGDKITATVRLGGKVELCGADVKLSYDKDKLEFIKFSNEDPSVMVNEADGMIAFNLVSGENITGDIDLFDVEFEIIDDTTSTTDIKFDAAKIVKFENESRDVVTVDYYGSNGLVYILK